MNSGVVLSYHKSSFYSAVCFLTWLLAFLIVAVRGPAVNICSCFHARPITIYPFRDNFSSTPIYEGTIPIRSSFTSHTSWERKIDVACSIEAFLIMIIFSYPPQCIIEDPSSPTILSHHVGQRQCCYTNAQAMYFFLLPGRT